MHTGRRACLAPRPPPDGLREVGGKGAAASRSPRAASGGPATGVFPTGVLRVLPAASGYAARRSRSLTSEISVVLLGVVDAVVSASEMYPVPERAVLSRTPYTASP